MKAVLAILAAAGLAGCVAYNPYAYQVPYSYPSVYGADGTDVASTAYTSYPAYPYPLPLRTYSYPYYYNYYPYLQLLPLLPLVLRLGPELRLVGWRQAPWALVTGTASARGPRARGQRRARPRTGLAEHRNGAGVAAVRETRALPASPHSPTASCARGQLRQQVRSKLTGRELYQRNNVPPIQQGAT